MFLEGQVDRQTDRQKGGQMADAKKQYPSYFIGGGGLEISTEQRIKCHVQEHSAVFQVRLEPTTHRYRVCAPQLGSILCRYDTCPKQYAPDLRRSILCMQSTQYAPRESILCIEHFCGSTMLSQN